VAVLALAFVLYDTWLSRQADPIEAQLAQVGLEQFAAPASPAPVRGPTLKQLLTPEIQAGVLTVEEDGGRTTVTIPGGNLFESGSATINAAYEPTLAKIAAALNKVAGPVRVVGHTDDQAIHSFRYHDNYELSRDRAESVANVLKQTIDNPARLTLSGAGSSQPKYQPESDPANRARNRRVEIIHLRGA
jgi:type VI secretion system protein ImpK